jgi:hypothetical protein
MQFARCIGGRLLHRLLATVTLAGLALALVLVPETASAQSTCSPIATGLAGPRFVAVADDGTVYVSEAGTGGTETLQMPSPAE